MTEIDTQALHAKIDAMHEELTTLRTNMAQLAAAMVQIARIEVMQTNHADSLHRAFLAIERIEQRLKLIEESSPVQKLITNWVLAWIAGAIGLIGGAVAMKVLDK